MTSHTSHTDCSLGGFTLDLNIQNTFVYKPIQNCGRIPTRYSNLHHLPSVCVGIKTSEVNVLLLIDHDFISDSLIVVCHNKNLFWSICSKVLRILVYSYI